MFKWFKQLFCFHIWYRDKLATRSEDGDWILGTDTCRKCGHKLYWARSMYG